MTKKEIMNELKAQNINFNSKAKKEELEKLLTDSNNKEESENTFADEFVNENEQTLESMLEARSHNLIPAHGGFALRRERKRVCEVSQNKRTKLYKVAFHKATYERSTELLKDFTCEEQKLNYIVRNLKPGDCFKLIEILYARK